MIVGIKIGFNARITHSKNKAFKSGIDATTPGALTGIPLTGKFGFHYTGSRYEQKFIPAQLLRLCLRIVFAK